MIEAIAQAEPTEVKPEFHITNAATADWYLKQLAAIDAEIALWKAQAQAAIEELQRDREGLEFLYKGEFEHWAKQAIATQHNGKKHIILAHGTVKVRPVSVSVRISNAPAAIEWAKANHPDLVTQVPKLDGEEMQKIAAEMLKTTGEILPGYEKTEAHTSVSVTFGKTATK